MDQKNLATYEPRRVIFFGAVASSSLIFSLVFLLFLGSQVSQHPGTSTNTLGEMMGYIEFFLFAFGSYFAAAVIVLRGADRLSRFGASWPLVAVLGSFIFSVTFVLRIWMSSGANNSARSSDQPSLLGLWAIPVSVLISTALCSLITLTGCGLASAIVVPDKRPFTLSK